MKRSMIALAALASAALALSACSADASGSVDAERKVLTLGVAGGTSFDPTGSMSGAGEGIMVWQGVYDTLITLEADGSLTPGLAEEWSYDDSRTTFTMRLRDGVTFSDGEVFDADAVKANLDRVLSTPSPNSVAFASISGVAAPDGSTVEITLSQPDPGLEINLANVLGVMVSPAALDNPDLANEPVGTGAYVMNLEETDPSTRLVFDRRDGDHWNADKWTYDEIVMKVMPDQTARINALRAGEIDATSVSAQAVAEVEGAGIDVLSTPGGTVGLGIFDRDGTVQPALAEPKVRQAINYAFDRDEMLKSIQLGYGRTTTQMFPGIEPDGGTEYDYDPEKAKKLLAEAGYPDGFSMTGVDIGTGSPLYAIITDRLAAIGIDMQWQPVAPTDAIAEMFSRKYPAFNSIWDGAGLGGEPWPFVSGFFLPGGIWNVFNTEDPELTALIDQIRVTEGDERDAVYAKIDGWLSTNAWLAPFYQVDFLYGVAGDRVQTEMAVGNATPFLWSFRPAG